MGLDSGLAAGALGASLMVWAEAAKAGAEAAGKAALSN
jgi:hypothetical protein